MLDIGEAQHKILEDIPVLGSERIHILEALGRVLAEDIRAIRDVPLADNSAMDGYCCKASDVRGASQENPVRLKIIPRNTLNGAPSKDFACRT
ncbi:MAG: molybdopterin molybdenumtransferase MoeA, partial [Desulfomonilaceae bacterium]